MTDWEDATDWEPVLDVPQDQAVSPQIPFTSTADIVAQGEAQQQQVQQDALNQWRLENIKRQYGPVQAGAMAAAAEIAQPVLGAADIMGVPGALETSDVTQRNINQLAEARPGATVAGQIAPYLATAPLATAGYMKAVNAMRPGWWQKTLANPLMSSVIPGSVEGGVIAGLNPQQSGLAGAALGAGGAYAGQKLIQPFSKQATNLSPYAEEMLKISDDWNIRQMPGAKSGIPGFMKTDDALLKAGDVAHIPAEQNSIITNKVLGVAGLDADNVVPGQMFQHRQALGKRYDALERNATPTLTDNILDGLETSKQAFTDLNLGRESKVVNDLESEFLSLADEVGEIPTTAYKGFKNKLKRIISGFEGKALDPEQGAVKSYAQDLLSHLRGTMRAGTADTNILKQWDELDSQFAATRFLEDNRILDSGSVDAKRLYGAMNTKMPQQLHAMTGSWGDMAKAANLGKYIDDSTQATLGAHHTINKLMGSRQSTGVLSGLTEMGAPRGFVPDALANYYAWANPKVGAWRLPAPAPLFGGSAGSAVARGGPLMERNR